MKRLTLTQLNALRLAAERPTCLTTESYYRPTIRALERLGLIESYGSMSIGDGFSSARYGITKKGREMLPTYEGPYR